MIYVKWFILAILNLLTEIVGLIVVPFALLFSLPHKRLPFWAQWWDNDREPIGDLARKPPILASTGFKVFWLRFIWLAVRNPSNNFAYWTGFKQTSDICYTLISGDLRVSDNGIPGHKFVKAFNGKGDFVAWEYYRIIKYSKTRCVRIRLGWKIDHNLHDNGSIRVNDGSPAQLANVINPFDGYNGT